MTEQFAPPVQHMCEDAPGPVWQAAFQASWPGYEAWFLRAGDASRPTYLACERALSTHMPELLPLWESLVDSVGGGDRVARFLALYCPPPYLTACSQAAWTRAPQPLLIRNYDYIPRLWEARLWQTQWNGRGVIGMSDCMWGLLDGINDVGLAVSLAFGGSRALGDGFGIPLILRYVLQTCDTTAQAVAALCRIPCNMAYNVTVLDAQGNYETVHLVPDGEARVTRNRVATNHQGRVDWFEYAVATATIDRYRTLNRRIVDSDESAHNFVRRFLEPPVYVQPGPQAWRTLYTAVYAPETRSISLLWPDASFEARLPARERAATFAPGFKGLSPM